MESGASIHVSCLTVEARKDWGERRVLLSDISFDIQAGQFVTVIGASGCGKSTLIQNMVGLRVPTRGRILFAGHSVVDIKEELPLAIGYIPQFAAFHGGLTVEENLRYAVALRLPSSVPAEVKENWVRHIVELSRIESLLPQPYKTLSGGQMRRIALAEELIGDPAFLLLDELTSGLDPFSDREMMQWLGELAHVHGKTVILVTHATYHLEYCDRVLFLDRGCLVHSGSLSELLESHGVASIADLYAIYQTQDVAIVSTPKLLEMEISPQVLKTARPPSGFRQFLPLVRRQTQLFLRDRGQIVLHFILIVTFPVLVAIFSTNGLPQVRNLALNLETNIVQTLSEQLLYLAESFHAAALISGLAMFQVVLLTLMGANNGAREIAKERDVLAKELRAGLSPSAYVLSKFLQILLLSAVQAFWMAWFVRTICGFPGSLIDQFTILFGTTLSMSAICLGISAMAPTPERASLLAIYLVGFQLPLSGAALALPEWLSVLCRPFIAAYWGWSGYLKTFGASRHYDIVKQSTQTFIAPYGSCLVVFALHIVAGLFLAWYFVKKPRAS